MELILAFTGGFIMFIGIVTGWAMAINAGRNK